MTPALQKLIEEKSQAYKNYVTDKTNKILYDKYREIQCRVKREVRLGKKIIQ